MQVATTSEFERLHDKGPVKTRSSRDESWAARHNLIWTTETRTKRDFPDSQSVWLATAVLPVGENGKIPKEYRHQEGSLMFHIIVPKKLVGTTQSLAVDLLPDSFNMWVYSSSNQGRNVTLINVELFGSDSKRARPAPILGNVQMLTRDGLKDVGVMPDYSNLPAGEPGDKKGVAERPLRIEPDNKRDSGALILPAPAPTVFRMLSGDLFTGEMKVEPYSKDSAARNGLLAFSTPMSALPELSERAKSAFDSLNYRESGSSYPYQSIGGLIRITSAEAMGNQTITETRIQNCARLAARDIQSQRWTVPQRPDYPAPILELVKAARVVHEDRL
jgi:hypothetical protein